VKTNKKISCKKCGANLVGKESFWGYDRDERKKKTRKLHALCIQCVVDFYRAQGHRFIFD